MNPADPLEQRLRQLRQDFDSSFARPWQPKQAEPNAVLCFRAAGRRFAAPLAELQTIGKAGQVVPVPSQAESLLGLTMLRGKLVPVFSLAALLGLPAGSSETCWLAVLRGRRPAALAVEALDGYAERVLTARSSADAAYPFAKGHVRHQDQLHVLLDCAAIYGSITRDPLTSMKAQDPTP